jgi:RES domain-containing protein
MLLWRISNYASLDGEGGMFASGRWHKAERRIVYSSDHPAAALLELLVHLDPVAKPKFYKLLKIEAPKSLTVLNAKNLPHQWQDDSNITQKIGNRWLDQNESAILVVPSAIVPETSNYLINPQHPDAALLKIIDVQAVPLDERLR